MHIAALGTGTIREARNGGRYLVEVKGRSMIIDGARLRPVEPRKGGRRSGQEPPSQHVAVSVTRQDAAASIDLHGMTVAEGLTALDAFLNEAILGGLAEVRVIHGRSGGRIRQAVHRRLKELPSILAVRIDPGNPGVTIVSL
ncbi:MAG: Smr/MutS family protein [Vicinamibacterales bacterium]